MLHQVSHVKTEPRRKGICYCTFSNSLGSIIPQCERGLPVFLNVDALTSSPQGQTAIIREKKKAQKYYIPETTRLRLELH